MILTVFPPRIDTIASSSVTAKRGKGPRVHDPEAISDDRMAARYDDWPGVPKDAEDTADLLAGLKPGGRALELGVGTGRVALPLARRGLDVHGIELSTAMVEVLRNKPDADRLTVHVGDLGLVDAPGRFDVVYAVYSTIFMLLTQDAQVECFARVADHLAPGGVFVVEAFVPDQKRWSLGQATWTKRVRPEEVILATHQNDPVTQRIVGQDIHISAQGIELYPSQSRYAPPAELDLMARLAGLRLRERWSGWRREPFTAGSGKHVSVYG